MSGAAIPSRSVIGHIFMVAPCVIFLQSSIFHLYNFVKLVLLCTLSHIFVLLSPLKFVSAIW